MDIRTLRQAVTTILCPLTVLTRDIVMFLDEGKKEMSRLMKTMKE